MVAMGSVVAGLSEPAARNPEAGMAGAAAVGAVPRLYCGGTGDGCQAARLRTPGCIPAASAVSFCRAAVGASAAVARSRSSGPRRGPSQPTAAALHTATRSTRESKDGRISTATSSSLGDRSCIPACRPVTARLQVVGSGCDCPTSPLRSMSLPADRAGAGVGGDLRRHRERQALLPRAWGSRPAGRGRRRCYKRSLAPGPGGMSAPRRRSARPTKVMLPRAFVASSQSCCSRAAA